MEVFTAASHHDVLALVTQIAILLITARMLGEIAQRLGQPSVVGELLAGIILGPSVLGKIFPAIYGVIIPGNPVQGYLLEAISLVGAMMLLLLTGLETDLKLIQRHARVALGVSIGGLVLPFITGFFLGQNLPETLLAENSNRLVFSLFIATAMSISAIPVLAKVLMDLKMTRTTIGQTMIAAGMTDDTIGWILLSVVAGLASGQAITLTSVGSSIGTVLIFMLVSYTLGRRLVKMLFDFVQDHTISAERLLTLVVALAFGWGALTHALHLEAVLGAFVMGIILGQMPRLPRSVYDQIESMTVGIFAPIFFAVAGLKVNALDLFKPDLFGIALAVIGVASFGKIVGCYIGARFIGKQDHWTALSFGAALNARGAMEIIVATIGLSLGILTQEMFSIIVLMAITTSLMAPTLLRWTIKHVKVNAEELKRREQEQFMATPVGQIHRILVPVRHWESDQPNTMQIIKAKIIQKLGSDKDLSITLLTVGKSKKGGTPNVEFLNGLGQLFQQKEIVKKHVESNDVINAVLDEAQKEYQLLVLGASAIPTSQQRSENLFSKVIDSLVSLSPCMTMVVHANALPENWSPRKILVPTNGSAASKRAAEFGFLLTSSPSDHVHILNVIEHDANKWHNNMQDERFKRQLKIAQQVVEDHERTGKVFGAYCTADIKVSLVPETIILDVARHTSTDLIILGTDVRFASDRLFLGPRVEQIIRHAPCPVIILNTN